MREPLITASHAAIVLCGLIREYLRERGACGKAQIDLFSRLSAIRSLFPPPCLPGSLVSLVLVLPLTFLPHPCSCLVPPISCILHSVSYICLLGTRGHCQMPLLIAAPSSAVDRKEIVA